MRCFEVAQSPYLEHQTSIKYSVQFTSTCTGRKFGLQTLQHLDGFVVGRCPRLSTRRGFFSKGKLSGVVSDLVDKFDVQTSSEYTTAQQAPMAF